MMLVNADKGESMETVGWSINGAGSLQVGRLPERDSPAIYVVRDGEIRAIAYVRSAREAAEIIDMIQAIKGSVSPKPDRRTPPESEHES